MREASSSSPKLFAPPDLGLDLSVRFELKNQVLKPEYKKWGEQLTEELHERGVPTYQVTEPSLLPKHEVST